MLKNLSLTSIILIDHVSMTFENGFHVLTGETGAGKTLLIQAIHLLTGKKVSSDLIRKGEEKAVIEATFQIDHLPHVQHLLTQSGIDFDPDEFLIIRREVHKNAKNLIYLNAQMAPLSLLSALGPHLIELTGQNASQSIRQSSVQLELLDTFGDLQEERNNVELTFEKENGLKRQLETLLLENSKEDLERLKEELSEWDQLSYIEGEEETLFEEYKTLASSKETADSLLTVQQGLEEGSLFDTLARLQKIAKDKTLKEQLGQALFHLQEASFTLSKQLDTFENSPEKLALIDDRLKTISRLKKKNHLASSEIPSHIEAIKKRINTLENLDQTIEETKRALKETSEKALANARHLSKKRQEVGALLTNALEKELRSLNFSHAKAPIEWREKPLGPTGIDEVSFLLSANKGEPPASLKNQTSGGELARYLLALKILLGTKGGLPTLIFDEIDANIGGETARIVGEKLKTLGGHTQILAITHFPQVARSADHHLHIAKSEKEGRTSATIAPLTATEKDTELLRMLGVTTSTN